MTDPNPDTDRRARIAKAWRNWVLLFVPAFGVLLVAAAYLDRNTVLLGALAFLLLTLAYQRYVKKRSWRSILWGVYTRDD